MARIPLRVRASFVIRRRALRQGVLGPSTFWKVVAVGVFGRTTLKRVFGKHDEPIGRWVLGPASIMTLAVSKPLTRRAARRAGLSLVTMRARGDADAEVALRAKTG